jgi:hypothetical protein
MPVRADLAELEEFAATSPNIDGGDLQALQSVPEVLAYLATYARAQGRDEADDVEVVARFTELSPNDLRHAQAVLRPLGYTKVCDRLKQIAGRRKHELKPLVGN